MDDNEAEEHHDANIDECRDDWSDDGQDWLEGVHPESTPAEPRNIDGFWDTDRVRRVMYRETESRIGSELA